MTHGAGLVVVELDAAGVVGQRPGGAWVMTGAAVSAGFFGLAAARAGDVNDSATTTATTATTTDNAEAQRDTSGLYAPPPSAFNAAFRAALGAAATGAFDAAFNVGDDAVPRPR